MGLHAGAPIDPHSPYIPLIYLASRRMLIASPSECQAKARGNIGQISAASAHGPIGPQQRIETDTGASGRHCGAFRGEVAVFSISRC